MKPEEIKEIPLIYVRGFQTKNQLFDKSWKVAKNIDVTLSDGSVITIYEGFETDLSSMPEFLWSIMKPFGDWLIAALVHDYLYSYGKQLNYTRKFADKEMLKISLTLGANKLDAYTRFYGVRLFGGKKY